MTDKLMPIHQQLVKIENSYYTLMDGEKIPCFDIYHNRYHANNCYLRLLEGIELVALTKAHLDDIAEIEGKALQVMLPADHEKEVSILEECGFVNVRKCYELKVSRKHCNLLLHHDDYLQLDDTNDKFKIAAEMVFDYYKLTHHHINPLSIDFKEFITTLPRSVYVQEVDGKLVNVSFVEENEIAYVASNDYETFEGFISSVINHLFLTYDEIEFEVDSTDDVAQLMLRLVNKALPVSFDTWLYKQ